MDKNMFIAKVEEVCELPPNTLKGTEVLKGSSLIDSLALLGLVSMFDRNFKINLTIDEIMSADSLNSLYDKVTSRPSLN